MNWDLNDIRHFLAVARTGSTLAAAKALSVNQTTCARRIAALEAALGLTLFEHAATGYRLTVSGAALTPHAERIEAAAGSMTQAAREMARAIRAEIRFSTSDVLADLIAGPAIASFVRDHPEISVALHVDSRAVDLGADEADVALRAAPQLDDTRLVARKVMETPWAFYCAAGLAPEVGWPASPADLPRYPLATLEGRPAELLRGALPAANFRYVGNSMKALIEVIKSSECVGALPMLIGERQPELRRCFVLDLDAGGLWILFPARLRRAPHIRAFVDHLVAYIQTWRQTAAKPS